MSDLAPAAPTSIAAPPHIPGAERDLVRLLAGIEDGQFAVDATTLMRELQSVMAQAALTAKSVSGELTVKLKLKQEGGVVEINADVAIRKPKLPRAKSVRWPLPGGGFAQSNPAQMDMLRPVTTGRAAAYAD
ncbi:hypothetical protein P7L78_22170 [Tistrella bauzanensis]|uniref:hypothetical protein n=1 Tax=Tistrella TaxID=171436 RepID=UPI0031F70353